MKPVKQSPIRIILVHHLRPAAITTPVDLATNTENITAARRITIAPITHPVATVTPTVISTDVQLTSEKSESATFSP